MSFIDNLNNINCTADLFRYIGELETKLEEVEKQRDLLLIQLDKATRPEVGFKIDYEDYNVNVRKREL